MAAGDDGKREGSRPMRVWFSLIYQGPPQKLRRHKINDPRQYAMF